MISKRKSGALIALILLQTFCVMFFVTDIIDDIIADPVALLSDTHTMVEIVANLAMVAAVVVEALYLRRLLIAQAHAARTVSVASGALHEVMEGYFRDWGLTPSEADVANFTIKGYAIAEIATLRGSAEGTVKTHLNAIYRKSGLAGRGQLVSILIEDLLGGPMHLPAAPDTDDAMARQADARGKKGTADVAATVQNA